jgi:hypothetical protein
MDGDIFASCTVTLFAYDGDIIHKCDITHKLRLVTLCDSLDGDITHKSRLVTLCDR